MTVNANVFAAVSAGEISSIDGGTKPSQVLGSIAGALIGFGLGGPIGAAVGAAIPHVFD
jgi:hypothetical protein